MAEQTLSEKKLTFLKRVVDRKPIDICEVLKNDLDFAVNEYDVYETLVSTNRNRSDKYIGSAEILDLYKFLYDVWFDHTIDIKHEKARDEDSLRVYEKLETEFDKKSMSPKDCQKFIYETLPKMSPPLFAFLHPQHDFDPADDFAPTFLHVHPYGLPPSGAIACRLYLNLKAENVVPVVKLFVNECTKKEVKPYLKFDVPFSERNDNLVFYMTYNKVKDQVEILKKIRDENPELFEGAENTNPLLAKIYGFIGFAEEPKYKRHSSFNLERADAIEEFIQDSITEDIKMLGELKDPVKIPSLGEEMDMKTYLKRYLTQTFHSTLDIIQEKISHKMYPSECKTPEEIKDYIITQNAIYKLYRHSLPKYLEEQFDEIVENPEESLLQMMRENELNNTTAYLLLSFKIKNGFLKRPIQKEVKFSLDIRPKSQLIYDFNLKERAISKLSKETLKPYFDKHHVSYDFPYLNLETEQELLGGRNQN